MIYVSFGETFFCNKKATRLVMTGGFACGYLLTSRWL